MHKIQRQLHTDHFHLQRLLNCFSQEIDCYGFDSKREADLDVILSALNYVHIYPDKWHHPAEDAIFDKLIRKKVKESELIKELQNEHQQIINETNTVLELFNNVAEDCIVTADELLNAARHFITLQKQHLEKENEHVYPLMDTSFSEKDWLEIEKEVVLQSDPLFGNTSRKEYDHLYRYIMALEKDKEN